MPNLRNPGFAEVAATVMQLSNDGKLQWTRERVGDYSYAPTRYIALLGDFRILVTYERKSSGQDYCDVSIANPCTEVSYTEVAQKDVESRPLVTLLDSLIPQTAEELLKQSFLECAREVLGSSGPSEEI